MKKTISLLSAFLAIFILSACVQVQVKDHDRGNQLVVSSVRDMPVKFPQASLFSLSPKYVKEATFHEAKSQAAYQMYTNAIVADLQKHGFVNTASATQADFHVGFGIALSQDLSEDAINKTFGISPGLPEQESLKKGSFLVYIEDNKTGERVWRGIAQGFAHDEFTPAQRKQRAEQVVSIVMKQFYQGN